MDHMKSEWEHEMNQIRKTVQLNEGIGFSDHIVKKRMQERNIDLIDIAYAFLTGRIYEGYDVGQYPKYRNPDMFRTIIGMNSKGEYITVGVALKTDRTCKVTTVYVGVPTRLRGLFE